MTDRPHRRDYATPRPPTPREPGWTVAEHAAVSGAVVTVVVGVAVSAQGAVVPAVWAFVGGLWATAGRGGWSVAGWAGLVVGFSAVPVAILVRNL